MTRIAFFGTPEVAVPALHALAADPGLEVVVVVTNPDRAKGRSKQPVPPPVKVAAQALGIEVLQPQRPVEILDQLRALHLDAVAIVAYGAILPQDVLDAGGRGFVNLHFSLLPRWRGAAPVQAAIREGDAETGVTCFVLDQGMDTGPVLRTLRTPIASGETSGELLDRLAEVGAPVLVDAIHALVGGEEPTPQPAEGSTIAGKVRPDDVVLDWSRPSVDLARLVASANPAPGAHTTFRGKRFKVWRATAVDVAGQPGAFVDRQEDGMVVGTGDGGLLLLEVQPEGKPRMDGSAFANGYQPGDDDRLGS